MKDKNVFSRRYVALLVIVGASLAGCPIPDATLEKPSPACSSDADCDDGNPCTADACDPSQVACVHSNVEESLAPMQVAGDCQVVMCDGKGGLAKVPDDADIPVSASDCTENACLNGELTSADKPSGAACGLDDALHCDGAGHCVGCEADSQCDASPSYCLVVGCGAEKSCEATPRPNGTALPADQQIDNDCMKWVCDGMGNEIQIPDSTDVLDDGNGCTEDTCAGGAPTHKPLAAGSACGGNRVCDGNGMCLGGIGDACSSNAQCMNGLCVDGVCCSSSCTAQCMSCNVPGKLGTCANTPFPGTDGGCSGTNVCNGAGLCKDANGQSCTAAVKCASGTCSGGVCKSKSGQACVQDADCVSEVCSGGSCQ